VSFGLPQAAAGQPRARFRLAATAVFALALVLAGLGCAPDDSPAPDPGDELNESLSLLEGSRDRRTEAVTFRDDGSGLGYAVVSVDINASTDGPSHFIYEVPFTLECNNEECWPQVHEIFVRPGLAIFKLAWSPRGSFLAFEGRDQGDLTAWIYTLQVGSGNPPRKWITGSDPSFTADAGLIVYVENGRDGIRAFNPSGGGGGAERLGLTGAANPKVSPSGRYIAYSAIDGGRGRRIFVHDRENPAFLADPVSDPDELPMGVVRDGTDDDLPAWSPHGRFVAYRSKTQAGTIRDAVFVTRPAGEPENVIHLFSLTPGRQLTSMSWHRGGEHLVVAIDGDVFVYSMPEAYRDP
jgi:Tol biopolymer transport system component